MERAKKRKELKKEREKREEENKQKQVGRDDSLGANLPPRRKRYDVQCKLYQNYHCDQDYHCQDQHHKSREYGCHNHHALQ